jgi:hypothetical protein
MERRGLRVASLVAGLRVRVYVYPAIDVPDEGARSGSTSAGDHRALVSAQERIFCRRMMRCRCARSTPRGLGRPRRFLRAARGARGRSSARRSPVAGAAPRERMPRPAHQASWGRVLRRGLERLLQRRAPLEVVPELAHVSRPGRELETGQERGLGERARVSSSSVSRPRSCLAMSGMSAGRSRSAGRRTVRTARRK